ncbi:hypothetical protein CH063_11770 [Colletotrichum higginsianum]|uniref:Uncharacterized protein n=2 Tax=Colletotrichum higginsianum TaxID=80884 RepID=H1VMR6_COLHI|nr:hypothetical protein CH63R_03977 [Colletotrichum higginsianum IMI 349063]OBR11681.1 hypothetical protein CH63R_03977 [Colletotrichum higginsianum IMI 349063]TIC98917.1 hypothetical protein CH35J_006145 [Colletotrichum higginsianum]CCF41520.1 hypothetical protein CH063_11770 [Colletotrichum higginsianum]
MKPAMLIAAAVLPRVSLAVFCAASAYLGSGRPGSCTGQNLGHGNLSRPGVSECFTAINGACALVVNKQSGRGCNCSVNLFSGGDCNRTSVGTLACSRIGASLKINFDHFNIRC